MACPRCGSNDLWDDNLSWGCNPCGYMNVAGQGSMILAKDKPGLARHSRDIKNYNQPFGAQLVRTEQRQQDDEEY